MKKKLLVGLLVLTMLVACVAVSASAAAEKEYLKTAEDLNMAFGTENVTVTGDSAPFTVTISGPVTYAGEDHLRIATKVTLVLEANAKLDLGDKLLIVDKENSDTGELTIKGTGEITSTGKVLQVQNGATANIQGGTLKRTKADEKGNANTAVAVIFGSTLNMTAGTIDSAGAGLIVQAGDGQSSDKASTATIGGTAVITGKNIEKFSQVQVGDYATLDVEGNAKINGSVAVFKKGNLNVSGNSTIDGTKTGFGISTNGSAEGSTNESTDAVITVSDNAKVIGSNTACGIYLPAGELTVKDKAQVSGGAGIVARGGKVTVEGGTISATSTEPVTVGDAKDAKGEPYAVPPAAFVRDKAEYPADKNDKAELKGGEFTAKSGDAVTYVEKNTTLESIPNDKIAVTGGSYSSELKPEFLDSTLTTKVTSGSTVSYFQSGAAAEQYSEKNGGNVAPIDGHQSGPDLLYVGYIPSNCTKEEAKKIVQDAIDEVMKSHKDLDLDVPEDVAAGDFFAIVKGSGSACTVKFENSTATDTVELTGTVAATGAVLCDKNNTAKGAYKVTSAQLPNIGDINVEVYRVNYKAVSGVTGNETHEFVDEAHLEAAKKDIPTGFTLMGNVNKWTYGVNEDDDYQFTVSIGGEYVSPIDPNHKCPLTAQFKDMGAYEPTKLWYHTAMDYMVLNKYIQGYDDGTLQPNATATRAQTWVIVAQIKGTMKADQDPYWKPALDWAKGKNYLAGTEDPVKETTREELVEFLWKVAGSHKTDTKILDKYPDAASVADSAKTAMAWAVDKGILSGKDHLDGKVYLEPQSTGTRAEIAVLIYNWATLMK